MQTVLISGGTGMVGQQLTKHLLAQGCQIIILTRRIPTSKTANPNSYPHNRYQCATKGNLPNSFGRRRSGR